MIKTSNTKYSAFSDGECFVSDQGRGQELGEVFSSKELVDVMLNISETYNFSSDATVFEPGVGSGNFVCEILYQKLDKVMIEMENESIVKLKELVKEYEIRSLLALASITFNDIDVSNVERVKQRLCFIMKKHYSDNFKNSKIKNYYLKAISDIVNANGIVGDLLSKNFDDFLFVRYYRIKKNRIARYVYNFSQIYNYTLWSEDPLYKDDISYTNWVLEIDGQNIEQKQPKLKEREFKLATNTDNKSIYK